MYYITERLSEHIGETPEGFLLCKDVPLTRTGMFEYTAAEVPVEAGPDGAVKIQRDDDQVFAENTIASFEGKPVTINHPEGMVTPENWSELAHGVVQNVRRGEGEQEDLLLGDLLIMTDKGIELVKAGLREVSCGYDAQYEQLEKGKGRQTEIIGNHVALVTRGRAGGRCAIQDSKPCTNCGRCTRDKENTIMKEDMCKMRAKDLFKRIFPKSRFVDALGDEDLGEPMPVEGVDEVEKAQQAAAEAKAAAEQAVGAAQEAAEAAKQAVAAKEEPPPEEPPPEEPPVEDQEPDIAAIVERLDKLEALIQELIRIESEEGHDLPPVEDEDEEKLSEEGWEEEFNDVASNAEIIDPDIVVTPPKTKDAAPKQIKKIKMIALKSALTTDSAPIVTKLLGGRKLEALKPVELDSVFFTAGTMIAQVRDSKVQRSTVDTKAYFKGVSSEIEQINKANKNFWKK